MTVDPHDLDWIAPEPRQVKFTGCARCHGDGHDLLFQPFTNPVEVRDVVFQYWALCPTTGEPILLTTISLLVDADAAP